MNIKRLVTVASVCAVAVAGTGTPAALAGEITGNGTLKGSNGKSHCSFSGQNDGFHIPELAESPEDAATRVQSFGQIVRHVGPMGGIPGMACNPTVPPPPGE